MGSRSGTDNNVQVEIFEQDDIWYGCVFTYDICLSVGPATSRQQLFQLISGKISDVRTVAFVKEEQQKTLERSLKHRLFRFSLLRHQLLS